MTRHLTRTTPRARLTARLVRVATNPRDWAQAAAVGQFVDGLTDAQVALLARQDNATLSTALIGATS